MGLAPLHTWLPDAHSEAPSVVSALLSGALLNCAFLAILRTHSLLSAAGLGGLQRRSAGALRAGLDGGGGSIHPWPDGFQADAGLFQRGAHGHPVPRGGHWRRGAFGAMLHAVNHSLTKAMLFFAAGNILALYRTKSTTRVRGVLRTLPSRACSGWRGSWPLSGRRLSGHLSAS